MYKAIYFRSGEIDVDVPSCMKWTIRAHLRCINGFADHAGLVVDVATSLTRGGAVHHGFEESLIPFSIFVVPPSAVLRNSLGGVARAGCCRKQRIGRADVVLNDNGLMLKR